MNYTDYRQVKDLEQLADDLGFKISNFRSQYDSMCLVPKGTYKELNACLPVYARDAEFGAGTVEGTIAYLRGWQRCMDYMRALGVTTEKKVEEKEKYYNEKYKKQEELAEQNRLLKVLKT